jgi:hypothetical protein
MATPSSQSHGCDASPLLPPRHAGWIDVVDVLARPPPPLTVSGALHSSDGEEVEVTSMPHTIPDMGSEQPLWFSSMV